MRLGIALLRRHRLLYSVYWAIMAFALSCLLVSLAVFGPWVNSTERGSAWSIVSSTALGWFLFVAGITLTSMHLPIWIAHGVTRRDFCVGAGVFVLGSSLLFELLKLAGTLVEVLTYKAIGLWDELVLPYPVPTVATTLQDLLGFVSFMVGGWLVGLTFYRLPVWWALPVMPLSMLPVIIGMDVEFTPHWTLGLPTVAAFAAIGYVAARGVAIKPKKA